MDKLELSKADNILIIDKLAYLLNNTIEILKLIFLAWNLHLVDQALVEEKEAQIIKDNIKLRMHKWPARQYMAENLINDKIVIIN